jgi:hypothetical protein
MGSGREIMKVAYLVTVTFQGVIYRTQISLIVSLLAAI